MLNLKSFSKKPPAFPTLLNWAALIGDDIVLGKDGSFMSGWFCEGPDMSFMDSDDMAMTSDAINRAMVKMGSSFMVHVDHIREKVREYIPREFNYLKTRLPELVEAEREDFFINSEKLYSSKTAIFLTWLPPIVYNRKLVDLVFNNGNENGSDLTAQLVDSFKEALSSFEGSLDVLKLKKMSTYERQDIEGEKYSTLLEYFNFCFRGEFKPIALPKCAMYIDSIIGKHEFYTGFFPKIDDLYVSVVSINGFPSASYPLILSSLSTIPLEYRWSSRFIFLDKDEAISKVKSHHKKWKQKIRGIRDQIFNTDMGMINQDALNMSVDAESAITDISSDSLGYGCYTTCVVLMDEDEEKLKLLAKEVKQGIENIGFSARVETLNAVEGFLGTLPGNGFANVNRPLVSTMNLSDLLPISSPWAGSQYSPNPMYGNAPALMYTQSAGQSVFKLNLSYQDVGHTLIFGPTGSGKSTLLAFIALQFLRYKNSKIFVFDKGNSMKITTLACGGRHYDVGGEDFCFAPLSHLKEGEEKELTKATEWLKSLINMQNIDLTPEQKGTVSEALNMMQDSPGKTMSDFYLTVQDEAVKAALKPYIKGEVKGNLFDARETFFDLDNFSTFETDNLFKMGDDTAIPVLLYIFDRIDALPKGDPTLIILDEAWVMLGHKIFRSKLKEWLKVKRKENCSVIMATQSLSDARESDILDVIAESCPNRIFLPNRTAVQREQYEQYRNLGLNDPTIQIVARLTNKKHYLFSSPYGQKVFDLKLGPLALSFCGISSKEELNRVNTIIEKHGDEWIFEWIKQRELDV